MGRTRGWEARVAKRNSTDGGQDMLHVRRLCLRTIEEDSLDAFMIAEEGAEVIRCDRVPLNACIQATDALAGLQNIPKRNSG